jgi:8-amino-7-oxononanoate synthase
VNPNSPTEGSFAPTIVDLLRQRASYQPLDRAFTFLVDGETEELDVTYGELDRRARAIGAWLADEGMAGRRVLLLYPSGLDFIAAFLGCLYGGAIAVPAYPPRKNRSVERIEGIAADARAAMALSTPDVVERFEGLRATAPSLERVAWQTEGSIDPSWADRWVRPAIDGQTLAFLQYTSGSTGRPKGVMLSHGNLLHNSLRIMQAFEITRSQSGVFWLPSFHDMGLIGGILVPLYSGKFNVLMSPVAFLQKPLRWLQAITRYGATISGGPNFAYELCVRKIAPEQRAGLDLSTWSLAFNGAEPVRAETIDMFCEAFGPCGFRREAFYPCYGLAESTLMVTGGMKFEAPVIRGFDADRLELGEAVPADDSRSARRLVGSGRQVEGQDVVIADPESHAPLSDGSVGEIWVNGLSVAQGYWNRPEETAETFEAMLALPQGGDGPYPGPYMRTGDLGFFDRGELFVTGRLKDLIIIRGRNHYPQDIEQTVESSTPLVRAGSVAAFSIEADGRERVVVVAEVERGRRETDEITAAFDIVRAAVAREHELSLDGLILVRPNSVPKTSSGKIQRHACRRQFQEGSLEVVESSLAWQREEQPLGNGRLAVVVDDESAAPPRRLPTRLPTLRPRAEAADAAPRPDPPAEVLEVVFDAVRQIAAERAAMLSADTNIVELGLDSLERMEIVAVLEQACAGRFPEQILPQIETCREVAEAIVEYMPAFHPASLRARPNATGLPGPRQTDAAPAVETFEIARFPEVLALRKHMESVEAAGLENPYFGVHEGVAADVTRIDGREMISWATYNYLGMSGDEDVARGAKEAIDRFGTSVSASRLVSGERTLHGELERAVAHLVGAESAVTFVGGHATNETVIGHVVGPGDLVLHDALAHNSLLQGAILSGARRRSFPHNDFLAADSMLGALRSQYRRVLLVIEGIYSMDGDFADLPRFIDVAKRHGALLMVDEAHSIGVMGPTGRGIGEHFGVDASDVDIWMGTLSKSLGSCGGYIAGSRVLVEWLKYTVPGFVYSVGLPPAAAGAALAAIRLLDRQPERVAALAENSRLFLSLAREAGLDTGSSGGSAIVPVILGDSQAALRLSRALFARGINVQPILYPAVEESAARLRFFITSRHTAEQIRRTVAVMREELEGIDPTLIRRGRARAAEPAAIGLPQGPRRSLQAG